MGILNRKEFINVLRNKIRSIKLIQKHWREYLYKVLIPRRKAKYRDDCARLV